MSSKRFGLLTLALTVALLPTAAFAGGPLLVFDEANDIPYAYTTASTVPVYTDLGALGPVGNAIADGQVGLAVGEWSAVPTSALSVSVAGDFASVGLPDITGANAGSVIGTENGPGIHVIYDSDGSVVSSFFGAPPGVLGIASPDFATGSEITESWVVLNGSTIDAADTNGEYWTGVITHEFGHSINLAHTQTNGASIYFGDATTPQGCPGPYAGTPGFSDIETMYPFIDPSPGSIGLDVRTIEHPDDVTALSDIYPTGGYPAAFATISGTVYQADGVTPVTGVNVIVRNVNDPFADSNSQLSGNDTQGALGPDGRFEFNGLTPGEEYVVYIDEIVDGGFSTTPTSLTIDEEWWNASESADPNVDDVCDYTGIVVTAGGNANADIIFTDPGPVLLLGDDDTIEVALGFDFPFCDGNLYSTVWVNSNGNLTFGSGDTDFSESVSEFLSDQPRIAPLWDDLSPNQGGAVFAENTGGEFVVEFQDVPQFLAGDSNNFTVTLRPDGTYTIEYGAVATTDAIVGRTEGGGAADPGETDLSGETQPIGFGLQTIYEEFASETMDLANGSFDFTPCAELPFPILDVDTSPIVVDVVVDGSENATLNIGNAATPPAQNLDWALGAEGASSMVIQDLALSRRIPLFEPVRSRFVDDSSKGAVFESSPFKSERAARELKPLEQNYAVNPDLMATGPNVVADGSFELGAFGGAWVESSTNFGTPICSSGLCGTGTGTGPRTGTFWAWFGGIAAYESGAVSQSVVIPAGNATMSFWLEQIICDSPADYLSVRIDGNEVFRTDGGAAICGSLGYTEVTLDLAALGYADGAAHTVEFFSEIFANNGAGTNFFVDDVAIFAEIPECDFLTIAPDAGSTAAGDVSAVTLTFDATGFTPGTYNCSINLSSNGGDATIPVVMNVIDPVVVGELLFTDSSLSGACNGSWLYATLVPPDGVDPADISPSAILVDGVPADPGYSQLVDLDSMGGPDALVVRFDCNSVSRAIGCGDDIAVLVTSTLAGGQAIEFPGVISNGAVFEVTFGDSWDGIPLQEILDDMYGAGAVDAATGYEGYLCGDAITPYWLDNQVESWIVREVAGYANENMMGWYTETYDMPTIDGVDDGVIFQGSDGPGASAVINLPGVRRFGLWMNPRGAGDSANAPEPELFFTNRNYNDIGADGVMPPVNPPFDGDPQALIYNVTDLNNGVPTFIVAWEDLDYGSELAPDWAPGKTDNDFNDLVVEIRAASPVSAVAAGLNVENSMNGVRLRWEITGLELVDALEVHRTDPEGATTVVARFGRNDLGRIAEWTDTKADRAGTYMYQVAARVGDATIRSDMVAFELGATALVSRSQFRGAQPNPFNPRTEFHFALSQSEEVRVNVFDVSGRRVAEMNLGELAAGDHAVAWDATDSGGARVSSGVYFVQLVTPTATDRMRVVLLK